MKQYDGKAVFSGIAIGKIAVLKKEKQRVERTHVEDVSKELIRLGEAREKAMSQLKALYEKALQEAGESSAMIFDVHQMMLKDQDYLDSITGMIEKQQMNAEYAVALTGDNFADMFAEMDDDYMRARAADVKDISERLIRVLQGKNSDEAEAEEATIVVAEDLAPSETVQMDKSRVLAFVTRYGSSNSHTAILARTMNIPALIGVDYEEDIDGKRAVVDGFAGTLIVEPEQGILREYEKRRRQEIEKRQMLQELKGKENVTRSGKKIDIYANIGKVSDVEAVLQNDAGGVGLFRSEFLYLEKDTFPTEEEQFQAYKAVAESMEGKKVIIRTLDIGADKQAEWIGT